MTHTHPYHFLPMSLRPSFSIIPPYHHSSLQPANPPIHPLHPPHPSLCVSIFAPPDHPVTLTICLNGEPLLTLQPTHPSNTLHPPTAPPTAIHTAIHTNRTSANFHPPTHHHPPGAVDSALSYTLRRHRHAAGNVTCACVDEFVSLPAGAVLAVHYASPRGHALGPGSRSGTGGGETGVGAGAGTGTGGGTETGGAVVTVCNVQGFVSLSKL